ncbi:hypothetical protein [Brevundimonas sp.]|uniref:hypothetical protein n=1 Tax=Brevundimonas sp. TaxID=1871086 RepID=UPI0028987A70|nr:hypothetical protein [Brevundimonas sp.]
MTDQEPIFRAEAVEASKRRIGAPVRPVGLSSWALIDLAQALHRSDSEAAAEARDLVRQLIETVVVTPLPERGRFALTVKGKIAALVSQDGDCTTVVGAGAGFEPATFRL